MTLLFSQEGAPTTEDNFSGFHGRTGHVGSENFPFNSRAQLQWLLYSI